MNGAADAGGNTRTLPPALDCGSTRSPSRSSRILPAVTSSKFKSLSNYLSINMSSQSSDSRKEGDILPLCNFLQSSRTTDLGT